MTYTSVVAIVQDITAHGSTGEEVLHAADLALYQAKKEGRDRVLIAAAAAGAP